MNRAILDRSLASRSEPTTILRLKDRLKDELYETLIIQGQHQIINI